MVDVGACSICLGVDGMAGFTLQSRLPWDELMRGYPADLVTAMLC